MCRKHTLRKSMNLPLQRGFSMVAAIFLLVILTALGVFMLSISTMQQTTSTQDLLGSQAYQAAKAGIEWGAYQIMTPENTNPPTGGMARYACGVATVLPALGGSLSGFAVKIDCTSADFVERGNTVRVYQLTSTASFGTPATTSYIERRLSGSINTCRTNVNISPC